MTFEPIAKCCVDAECTLLGEEFRPWLKCKKRHVKNGRTDVPVSIIEVLRFSQGT